MASDALAQFILEMQSVVELDDVGIVKKGEKQQSNWDRSRL